MADSLLPECTPLKHEYDSCFNAWFEGYLEPAVAAGASPEERVAYYKQKADEFQAKCGPMWDKYHKCVQKAVKEKGLDKLLAQGREEYPLQESPSPPPPVQPTKSSRS